MKAKNAPAPSAEDCEPSGPAEKVDTYFHPHPGLLPVRIYSVTLVDSLSVRHEGRGLSLDTVLGYESRVPDSRPEDEGFFDEAVWENDRVVAVLRYSGATVETIRLAPPPAQPPTPDGPASTEGVA